MALRKVKGNFERMFDKNLTDLVRGIRNNKDSEVSIIWSVLAAGVIIHTDSWLKAKLGVWREAG